MSLTPHRYLAAGTTFLLFCLAGTATAEAGPRLVWREEWRRVGVVEYVSTAVLAGGYAIMRFLVPPAGSADWTEPLLMDRPLRGLLRAGTIAERSRADLVSGILVDTLLLYPVLVDSVLVVGIADENPDVAWQLGVIDAQSYALSLFLNASVKRVVGRVRPYAAECEADRSYHESCHTDDRYRSFFSNHSSLGATSAGLTCVHHTELPIYGASAADLGACIGALALAVFDGSLRIMADEHWASDVLTGLAVGASSGYVLPKLRYYRALSAAPSSEATGARGQGGRPQLSIAFRF